MKYSWQNNIEMLVYLQYQVFMTYNDMWLHYVSILQNEPNVILMLKFFLLDKVQMSNSLNFGHHSQGIGMSELGVIKIAQTSFT